MVKALLKAHPGAAEEKDGVRPPRPHNALSELRTHLLASALRRIGGCLCMLLPSTMRRRRWWRRCWRLTRARPRRGTRCSHHFCNTTFCDDVQYCRLRAYAGSLARLHAAQEGRLPVHVAAANQASEAVVAALVAAHPDATKKKDKVRPPLLDSTFCDDV